MDIKKTNKNKKIFKYFIICLFIGIIPYIIDKFTGPACCRSTDFGLYCYSGFGSPCREYFNQMYFALTKTYCFIGFVAFTIILMFSLISILLTTGFLRKGEKPKAEIKGIRIRGLGNLILPMICTSLLLAIFSATILFYLSLVVIFISGFICVLNTKMIMKNWFYILVSYLGIFYVLCYSLAKLDRLFW